MDCMITTGGVMDCMITTGGVMDCMITTGGVRSGVRVCMINGGGGVGS